MQKKTKPDSYPELAKVNHAEIRWKEYALNWGGLTDVATRQVIRHSEPWSKACREKSAEVIVVEYSIKLHEGLNLILNDSN